MLLQPQNRYLESLREPRNLVDIALVFLLVYALLRLIRGTRAAPMAAGIGGLALLYWTAARYDLATLEFILRPAPLYVGVAIIVLFQNEIRQALISFGNRFRMPFILRHRVAAAACFLPLTLNPLLSKDLGTRHRAAIGITEDTDAAAVVVSEETGLISFVQAGQIRRGLDGTRLRAAILDALEPSARGGDEREKKAEAEAETTKAEVGGQRLDVSSNTTTNL